MRTVIRGIPLALILATVARVNATAQQAPQVTVSGVVFAQYAYQLRDTAGHYNAFDVTRALVNVRGRFQGGLATRVSGDIYRAADSSTAFRLKYAYLAWTPDGSPLTWRFGMTLTPWIDFEESLWDYRMQGPIALDRNGFATPSDLGVAVDGHFGGERFNFQAGIYNGEGYAGGSGGKEKDVEARGSYRLLATDDSSRVGGLRLTAYAHVGTPTGGGTRNRFTGQLSYRTRQLTLAGEYSATTDSSTAGPVARRTGSLVSAFAVYRLPGSRVAFIARTDLFDPNTALSGDRQTRIIAGVSYQVTPNWRALVDLDQVSYESTPTAAQEARRSTLYFQNQVAF